jgi:hypothetical protein
MASVNQRFETLPRLHYHGCNSDNPAFYKWVLFNIFSSIAAQRGLWPPRSRSFLITHDMSQTVGLLLNEWSAHRRNLYLTTHNTHNTQISMLPVGFEPTIAACEQAARPLGPAIYKWCTRNKARISQFGIRDISVSKTHTASIFMGKINMVTPGYPNSGTFVVHGALLNNILIFASTRSSKFSYAYPHISCAILSTRFISHLQIIEEPSQAFGRYALVTRKRSS